MGATDFTARASGTTVDEAFRYAVDQAYYWHGHGGYTGTIAEKHGFVEYDLPPLPPVTDDVPTWMSDIVQRYSNALGSNPAYDTEDSEYPVSRQAARDRTFLVARLGAETVETIAMTYQNKWGAAVAIRVGEQEWGFIGYASC